MCPKICIHIVCVICLLTISAVREWTANKERMQLTKELLDHIHPARAETEVEWRFEMDGSERCLCVYTDNTHTLSLCVCVCVCVCVCQSSEKIYCAHG